MANTNGKEMIVAFQKEYPGLAAGARAADFVIGGVVEMVMAFFVVLAAPVYLTIWAIKHPVEAKMYASNAPALFTQNIYTVGILGIFVLLLLLIPDSTHKFAKYTFWALGAIFVIGYCVAIFRCS